jgi:hypothetical protein
MMQPLPDALCLLGTGAQNVALADVKVEHHQINRRKDMPQFDLQQLMVGGSVRTGRQS